MASQSKQAIKFVWRAALVHTRCGASAHARRALVAGGGRVLIVARGVVCRVCLGRALPGLADARHLAVAARRGAHDVRARGCEQHARTPQHSTLRRILSCTGAGGRRGAVIHIPRQRVARGADKCVFVAAVHQKYGIGNL